jgi:hypothetical protein
MEVTRVGGHHKRYDDLHLPCCVSESVLRGYE